MTTAWLLLLAVSLQAGEPAGVMRLEHAFDTIGGWSGAPRFSRDGRTFAVHGNGGVSVWDVETGVQRALIPTPRAECGVKKYCGVSFVALSPDGSLALLDRYYNEYKGRMPASSEEWGRLGRGEYGSYRSDRGSELVVWDVAAERELRAVGKFSAPCRKTNSTFQPFQCGEVIGSFSPDGKRLAFAVPTGAKDWRLEGYRGWWVPLEKEGSKPREAAGLPFFAADGRLLSAALKEHSAEIRDEDSGKRVSFLQDYWGKVWAWSASADGSVVAFHFKDKTSERGRAWDTATGRALFDRRWDGFEFNSETGLHLDASGRRLILAREVQGSTIDAQVHDLASGATAQTLSLPVSRGYTLTFSPDGRLMAGERGVGGDSKFGVYRVVWDGGARAEAAPRPAAAARVNLDAAPDSKTPPDPDAYAVVIGVERYRQEGLPPVDFAARDAETMARYLTGAMGFEPANVVLLQNDKATKTDLEKHLGPWLGNRVNAKSRVFVYYAGHGAPNPATGKGYLVPYEGDPNYTEVTGFPIQGLYDAMAKLPAKEVVVVLDSCFSGSGGRSVLAKGARPLVASVKAKAGANTTVLSAATGGQVSASHPQGRHGLLSYFLFEGLHGAADADKDGAVTTAELFSHARGRVEAEARRQNLEQTPVLSGSGTGVWLRR